MAWRKTKNIKKYKTLKKENTPFINNNLRITEKDRKGRR
jgi:hypothetical protein